MDFDWSELSRAQGLLLQGLRYTVSLTLFAGTMGMLFGTVLAVARLSSWGGGIPRRLADFYVWLLRSIPLVMVIFWFYFLVPLISGVQMGADRSAYITFSLFEAAYYCEIIRAGIQAVPAGQTAAGRAMGFSTWQNLRLVVLPQALRNVLPLLLMQTIILFQDTSLVYVVGATDLLGAANKAANRDNAPVELYLTVAVVYFTISFLLSSAVRRMHARIAIVR